MLPQWVMNLPWEVFDTLISFIELLILIIPAAVAFLYYRVHSLALYVFDITDNGATLLVHNKTNRSIIISNVQFVSSANSGFINPVTSWNKGIMQLKPDEIMEVVVNYSKSSHGSYIFQFFIQYDRKKIKKVKVRL